MDRQDVHGRRAAQPSQFRWPAWRDVGRRTKDEIAADRLSLVAAGVAFYAFLALFPAIVALVSIYGIVADPADIQRAISGTRGILPPQVVDIVVQQLSTIAGSGGAALGIGAAIGILLALWSATKGTKALIEALNIAYEEDERRGFLRLNAVALALTLATIVMFIVAIAFVVIVPAVIGNLGLPAMVATAVNWARWPLLALAAMLALAVVYRYAPSRQLPRWQWVSWGAAIATVLWLIASGLFSFYVSKSDSYNETYGSLAAIVILLMWFYISAFVVLLGAELNAEMEHQTAKDTTTGEPVPLGARGAAMADTVGAGEEAPERKPRRPRRAGAVPAKAAPAEDLPPDLAATRAALGRTLDELRVRLGPSRVAATVEDALAGAKRGRFEQVAKERPLIAGALGIAVGAALADAARRSRERPRASP